MLTNAGGPGGPGPTLPLVHLATERTRLTESRDIIGIDVRGTGGSTNAACAGAASTLDELDPRDRSEASTTLILDLDEATARTCQDATGDLSPVISTEQTVRDLELLRDLLDLLDRERIGCSGGTWLGAAHATCFPERVGALVLDANTEFTADWPETSERRFTVDSPPWAARYDARSGTGSTPEEVRATYGALRARLAEQPIPLLPGIEVGPVLLDDLVISALCSSVQRPRRHHRRPA